MDGYLISMLERYVSDSIKDAKYMEDIDELHHERDKLIGQLHQLEETPIINECIDYLEEYEWNNSLDVEDFIDWYEEAIHSDNPESF